MYKTFVYSPEVTCIIEGIDVSADVVSGTVNRLVDSASSLSLVLSNKDFRYTRDHQFRRMDRVVVWMKRVDHPIKVFTGYLNVVPGIQLYPSTVRLEASCTIKRLLYTYWDPGLQASKLLLNQRRIPWGEHPEGGTVSGSSDADEENDSDDPDNATPSDEMADVGGGLTSIVDGLDLRDLPIEGTVDGGEPGLSDTGLAMMLMNIMTKVGGWDEDMVKIANFPEPFFKTILANMPDDIHGMDTAGMEMMRDMFDFYEKIQGGGGGGGGELGPITETQIEHAKEIRRAASDLGLDPLDDASIIGYMVALQESGMRILANPAVPESLNMPNEGTGGDHDSVGIFQQRQAGWGCLPAHSVIFTTSGPVPIIDVKVGDEVWSFDGKSVSPATVVNQFMTGHQSLLTIKTHGRSLEVTRGHRIPIRRYFGTKDGQKVANQFTGPTCGWETIEVCAEEIREGDYLIVPHGLESKGETSAPDGEELSVGLMELIGVYLGDGNLDGKNRVEIAHGSEEYADYMPYYRDLISSEIGVSARVDSRGTRTRFSSPWFSNFIKKWVPGRSHEKRLPSWVFHLSKELQLALLRGYIDTDGSVSKEGSVRFGCTSKWLIEDIRHLCIQLGIPVGVVGYRGPGETTIQGRTYTTKSVYQLTLSGVDQNVELGSHSPRKAERFASRSRLTKGRYSDDWNSSVDRKQPMGSPPEGSVYHKVLSITEGDEEVPVYDISVDGLHHYIAEGIVVHNTLEERMNAYASARMFYDTLRSFNWQSMPKGAAGQKVQVSAHPEAYDKWENQARSILAQVKGEDPDTKGASGASSGGSGGGGGRPSRAVAGANVGTNVGASNASKDSSGSTDPNAPDTAGMRINDAIEAIACWRFPDTWSGERGLNSAFSKDRFTDNGLHAQAAACDMSNGGNEGTPEMLALAEWWHENYIGKGLQELIYYYSNNNVGHDRNVGNGQTDYYDMGTMLEHRDHVHIGMSTVPSPDGTSMPYIGGGNAAGGNIQWENKLAKNLFTYFFSQERFDDELSERLTGKHASLNDQPLIKIVEALCSARMCHFQSGPDGTFNAFYPDYFGMDGTAPVVMLEDIEIKDFTIMVNDNALATHVFAQGAHGPDPNIIQQGVHGYLTSPGIVTVEDEWLFKIATSEMYIQPEFDDAEEFLGRYGIRPFRRTPAYSNINSRDNPAAMLVVAIKLFMEKWAQQYQTTVELTFMPELFPGMRLQLASHNLAVYVETVTHTFDYNSNFSTRCSVIAPTQPRSQAERDAMWNDIVSTSERNRQEREAE